MIWTKFVKAHSVVLHAKYLSNMRFLRRSFLKTKLLKYSFSSCGIEIHWNGTIKNVVELYARNIVVKIHQIWPSPFRDYHFMIFKGRTTDTYRSSKVTTHSGELKLDCIQLRILVSSLLLLARYSHFRVNTWYSFHLVLRKNGTDRQTTIQTEGRNAGPTKNITISPAAFSRGIIIHRILFIPMGL